MIYSFNLKKKSKEKHVCLLQKDHSKNTVLTARIRMAAKPNCDKELLSYYYSKKNIRNTCISAKIDSIISLHFSCTTISQKDD